MARAKRIYILIIKVNKLFSFFSSRCFLKEIENMFSVFLSSYRNTRESLGELEKANLFEYVDRRHHYYSTLININDWSKKDLVLKKWKTKKE